jgi:hypothetical protein
MGVVVGAGGHGRGAASVTVPDAAVVLSAADEEADGLVVVFLPEHVVDECDAEVELPAYPGWNWEHQLYPIEFCPYKAGEDTPLERAG